MKLKLPIVDFQLLSEQLDVVVTYIGIGEPKKFSSVSKCTASKKVEVTR